MQHIGALSDFEKPSDSEQEGLDRSESDTASYDAGDGGEVCSAFSSRHFNPVIAISEDCCQATCIGGGEEELVALCSGMHPCERPHKGFTWSCD